MKQKKQVTAKQVANLAGVSISAVSRTFTPGSSLSPKMREKVMEAADTLGYKVNFLARGFNKQRIPLMGIVVSKLMNPFRSKLLSSLLTTIQRDGYNAMVCEVGEDDTSKDVFNKLLQYRVSGVIITSGTPAEIYINICAEQDIPTVVVNRECNLENVDVIVSDNKKGGEKAADLLLKVGCKQLAFINSEDSTFSGVTRGSAFLRTLATKVVGGEASFASHTVAQSDFEGGMELAEQLFKTPNPPDGIFCANDLLCCGFIDGARMYYNLHAGEDYSIIGFDDIQFADWPSFELATFQQNTNAIAEKTLQRLKERVMNQKKNKTIDIIPVTFVKRKSVKNNSPKGCVRPEYDTINPLT